MFWAIAGAACLALVAQPGHAAEAGVPASQAGQAAATGHTVILKATGPAMAAPAVAAGKSDLAVMRTGRGGEASGAAAPQGKSWTPRLIDVAVSDGQVRLNSYRTTTMPLDDAACAELGDDLVDRFGLSPGAVQRLADTDLMRQTRFCAANGSVLITCYNATATVSLRQPSPNDGCGG